MRHKTIFRGRASEPAAKDFARRLRQVISEFGSRYALAKASGIPQSTLQSYAAGSKPGTDVLVGLARVANLDLNWLLTGQGQIRPSGMFPGSALADVLMVDQYEMGAALNTQLIVGHLPFSRHFLETSVGLKDTTREKLLAVQADRDLYEVARGDLALIDRSQAALSRDGIYLLNLPGIVLRMIVRHVGNTVTVVGPEHKATGSSARAVRPRKPHPSSSQELCIRDLLGLGRYEVSKVIGRVVWIGRGI